MTQARLYGVGVGCVIILEVWCAFDAWWTNVGDVIEEECCAKRFPRGFGPGRSVWGFSCGSDAGDLFKVCAELSCIGFCCLFY